VAGSMEPSCSARNTWIGTSPRKVRRSIIGITGFDPVPTGRAILRPLPARPVRTSAEATGAAVSSGVAIRKHGGLPGGVLSAGPRSAAALSRARPSNRYRRSGSGRPHTRGGSERRRRDPRDVPAGSGRWLRDAPGSTSDGSPGGDPRGSLGPEPPGRGRAWDAIVAEPHQAG
jgi:hypothetical protein